MAVQIGNIIPESEFYDVVYIMLQSLSFFSFFWQNWIVHVDRYQKAFSWLNIFFLSYIS